MRPLESAAGNKGGWKPGGRESQSAPPAPHSSDSAPERWLPGDIHSSASGAQITQHHDDLRSGLRQDCRRRLLLGYGAGGETVGRH